MAALSKTVRRGGCNDSERPSFSNPNRKPTGSTYYGLEIMQESNSIDISSFRRIYPYNSNYMEINGFKYHYVDEGQGEPVVMVHGNPTWSFYYRSLINALSPDFRTIVPDHIGCGLSEKPPADKYEYRMQNRVDDLELFLDKLEIKSNINLIVHDWGGAIGMAYAVKRPERIKRLVVLNTAAFSPTWKKEIPVRLWIIRNIRAFAAPAVLGFNLFSRAALYMASARGLARDVKKGLIAPYNNWKNRIATLKFVQDIPLREGDPSYGLLKYVENNLSVLKGLPMLICWGMKDFVFNENFLAGWEQRFPEAEVHKFDQAGHYILEDEPAGVINLVKNFMEKRPD